MTAGDGSGMMTDKAAEARQLNLLTLLFAILAFGGILALGSVDAKTKQQRYRIAKTYQISERPLTACTYRAGEAGSMNCPARLTMGA
jgi:hypothetical protein